jgi:hypothetical protein
MRSLALLAGLSLLTGRAAAEAEAVTESSWNKQVTERVENGQFVFVKFLAPW